MGVGSYMESDLCAWKRGQAAAPRFDGSKMTVVSLNPSYLFRDNVNISGEVAYSPCYNSHVPQEPCASMKCMKAAEPIVVYESIVHEFIVDDKKGK